MHLADALIESFLHVLLELVEGLLSGGKPVKTVLNTIRHHNT